MAGTIVFGIDVESASEHSKGFADYGAELFIELGVPVTWYLTGKTLDLYPEVFRGIDALDLIELQAHTYDHVLLKTIIVHIPEGKTIHGSTDCFMERAASVEEIDADLTRCQRAFEDVLGRRATALTTPWGYYRGLADRPDLLELVHRHGFRVLRSFARDQWDGQPVPLVWQPFFYSVQGYPDMLECLVHDYQDDFYWEAFAGPTGKSYGDHLKEVAREVAENDLTWSLCSHDHGCATREGFGKKGQWFREVIECAKELGIRFQSASGFYEEMLSTDPQERPNVPYRR